MTNEHREESGAVEGRSEEAGDVQPARAARARVIELSGFQRKHLRGLAHSAKPIVLVGQGGISERVIEAVERALLDHELIKVHMRQPEDKKGMAAELARRSGAHLCGLVGHNAILYRPHPDEPQIVLPDRG